MRKRPQADLQRLLHTLPAATPATIREQLDTTYFFLATLHREQQRLSGTRRLAHAVAMAQILAKLGLHDQTLVAALLHDGLRPETGIGAEILEERFGAEVAGLVSDFHQLNSYGAARRHREIAQSGDGAQLEETRQAILLWSQQDLRVIFLRLADTLQRLREAEELEPLTRQALAAEAMHLDAPLANRLGIWQLKGELEDLAFRCLELQKFQAIATQLESHQENRERLIRSAVATLQAQLDEGGVSAVVIGRSKHIYSIYRKMERKGIGLDETYDIYGLRVVVDLVLGKSTEFSDRQLEAEARDLCYQALGVVHNLWQPIPQEFDDYIAAPKLNGYRSLHTTVVDENGQTLEVQIRTSAMHREAELGVAAHWTYKEGGGDLSSADVKRVSWLRRSIAPVRQAGTTSKEDSDLRQQFLGEHIYVFTPQGDLIELPTGATPIDFAYRIHTEVGHRCRGAKVNDQVVALDYQLESGDRVEIITVSHGGPSHDWLDENRGYTRSAQTRHKIQQWFRQQARKRQIAQGRELVERELKRLGLDDVLGCADISRTLDYESNDDFLAAAGSGDIQGAEIVGAIPALRQKLGADDDLQPLLRSVIQESAQGLIPTGVPGTRMRLAACCQPLPLESIKGYITHDHEVIVHGADCTTLQLVTNLGQIVPLGWAEEPQRWPIPIVVNAYHRATLTEDIGNVLRSRKMKVVRMKTVRAKSITTVYLLVEIAVLVELVWLLERLEQLPNVFEVQRRRWETW